MSAATLSGTPAADGVAIGTIAIYRRRQPRAERPPLGADDVAPELTRFRAAVEQTRQRIAAARETTAQRAGQQEAAIFDAHAMFLDDPAFVGEIERAIRETPDHAESAVERVTTSIEETFAALDDEYLRARAADVRDVAIQLLQALAGPEAIAPVELPPAAIVVADELCPSDTTLMDLSRLAGIATARGSTTAHVAILAGRWVSRPSSASPSCSSTRRTARRQSSTGTPAGSCSRPTTPSARPPGRASRPHGPRRSGWRPIATCRP